MRPLRTLNPAPIDVTDLAFDARRVTAGALFVCVPGFRADGHDFATNAVEQGAVALIVERPLDVPVPQLVVEDARTALGLAADAFFGFPTRELPVGAVTGTNGKTTTTFLLHAILSAAGRRPGLLGTIESRVGGERRAVVHTTPESLDLQRTFREMLDAGDRSCAMEASSHGSELRRLVGTRFAALAFTNLSPEHLDLHGTLDAYFDAKRRLFVEGDVDGRRPPAAVNVGDPYGRRLAEELRALGDEPLTFAVAGDAALRAEGLELDASGSRFEAGGLALETRLRGRFNVENVLAAVALARLLEVEDDAIVEGVTAVTGVPGRFEAVDEGQPFAVLVDFAHTPDALANVLAEAPQPGRGARRVRLRLRRRPRPRKAAADGGGRVAARGHRDRHLRQPAQRGSARDHRGGARRNRRERRGRARPRRGDRACVGLAREGDVVVIAGKGHEQGQEFAERTLPFDDREVARAALRRLRAGTS